MFFHCLRPCLFSSCLRQFGCHLVYLLAWSRIIASARWGQWWLCVAMTWKISRDGDFATWFADLFQCCVDFLMKDVFLIPNLNFPHQHLLPDFLAMLLLPLPRSIHLSCLMSLKVTVGLVLRPVLATWNKLRSLHFSQVMCCKVPLTVLIALCWILELDPS